MAAAEFDPFGDLDLDHRRTGVAVLTRPVPAELPDATDPGEPWVAPAPPPAPPPVVAPTNRHLLARRLGAGALAAWMLVTGATLLLRSEPREGAPGEAPPATAVDPNVVRVATARLPLVDVYDNPTRGTVLQTLEHPTPSGAPLVFLIEGTWEDWYRVRVPAPPAGTTGWVRAGVVDVDEHTVKITIDLRAHLLVARDDGDVVLRAPVAVGVHDRPQPGVTFVADRVVLDGSERHGKHALTLAGYANGDDALFRGSGLVAIHGVDDPLALGQTVSQGSIGLESADMGRLFDLAPLGTRVDVIADRADAGSSVSR